MRLIDADALKKCAIPCEIHNGALTDLCVPLYQIDNAPPVDVEPFALVSFSKEELNRIVEERVIEPIKNGELIIKEESDVR